MSLQGGKEELRGNSNRSKLAMKEAGYFYPAHVGNVLLSHSHPQAGEQTHQSLCLVTMHTRQMLAFLVSWDGSPSCSLPMRAHMDGLANPHQALESTEQRHQRNPVTGLQTLHPSQLLVVLEVFRLHSSSGSSPESRPAKLRCGSKVGAGLWEPWAGRQ